MIAGVYHPDEARAQSLLRRVVREAGGTSLARGAVVGAEGIGKMRAHRHATLGEVRGLDDRPLDEGRDTALRGPFALASIAPEGLVLARGVIGGRPLFYRQLDDGAVVACSRLAPLAALGPVSFDVEGLCAVITASAPEDPRRTIYEGIHRVLGGECLRFGRRGAVRSRLAIPSMPAALQRLSPDEAADDCGGGSESQ